MRRRSIGSPRFSLLAFQDIITAITGIILLITLLMALSAADIQVATPSESTEQLLEEIQQQIDATEAKISELRLAADATSHDPLAMQSPDQLRERLSGLAQAIAREQERRDELQVQLDRTADRKEQVDREELRRSDELARLQQLKTEIDEDRRRLAAMRESNRVIYNLQQEVRGTAWLAELTADSVLIARFDAQSAPRRFPSLTAFYAWVESLPIRDHYLMLLIKPQAAEVYEDVLKRLDRRGINYGYDIIPKNQSAIDATSGAGGRRVN